MRSPSLQRREPYLKFPRATSAFVRTVAWLGRFGVRSTVYTRIAARSSSAWRCLTLGVVTIWTVRAASPAPRTVQMLRTIVARELQLNARHSR